MLQAQIWFMWGVCELKDCGDRGCEGNDTYYGSCSDGSWYLNGRFIADGLNGRSGEIIRKNIQTKHFQQKDIEVDLYLDCDKGIYRLCVVGYEISDVMELQAIGLNNCGNKNGWVPNITFPLRAKPGLAVRCGKIDPSHYGKKLGIKWD